MCHLSRPPRRQLMTRLFPAPARGTLLVVGLPAENICSADSNGSARSPDPCINGRNATRFTGSTRHGCRGEATLPGSCAPACQANEVLDQLRKGQVSGRIVLTP